LATLLEPCLRGVMDDVKKGTPNKTIDSDRNFVGASM
jgi:hypothetical protein